MGLIEAFKNGLVLGIADLPEKIIGTQVSNIFLYKKLARKVYKKMNFFFGDLSNEKFRKDFYAEDFSWNQWMSPEIYLALKPVKELSGGWQICDEKNANDFYIEMLRVNTDSDLTNLLLENKINNEDLKNIVITMTSRLASLTNAKKDRVPTLQKKWSDILERLIEDLRLYSYMAETDMPKDKTDKIINKFLDFVRNNEYIQNFSNSEMEVHIDNHSDNILLINKKVEFIDIYPVKEEWAAVDRFHNICRPAADVAVLGNMDKVGFIMEEYKKLAPVGPEDVKMFYIIYCAMIKAPYYYTIGKKDLALRYLRFIDENLKNI